MLDSKICKKPRQERRDHSDLMDVLIDLDPAVYACGFAAQKTTYQLTLETDQGELSHATFSVTQDRSAGDQMKEFIANLPRDMHVIDKQKLVTPLPLSHCLHVCNRHVTAILDACKDRFGNCSFSYYLSGSANFRYRIAKQQLYKGNRLPESRPFHYKSIREYMETKWNPHITDGIEADDAISIAAEQARTQHKDTCVVSIDKDLDQICGWHYNPDKKVFYQQDRDSALLYLYQQILSGDSTDNIPGCYKVGTEGAKGRIAEWSEGFEEIGLEQEKTLWENIVATYRASQAKRGCPYASVDASEVALETARLVYIQRALNELFNPPGVAFGRTDIL